MKTYKTIKLTDEAITQRRRRIDSSGTTTAIHQTTITINKRKRKDIFLYLLYININIYIYISLYIHMYNNQKIINMTGTKPQISITTLNANGLSSPFQI